MARFLIPCLVGAIVVLGATVYGLSTPGLGGGKQPALADPSTMAPPDTALEMAGQAAPDFTLIDADGKQRSFDEFKGQVVLLSFLDLTCDICTHEARQLQTEYWQKHRDKGLAVVGLGVHFDDDPLEETQRFREVNRLSFPLLLDDELEMWGRYRVTVTPTNFVIDREGQVRRVVPQFDRDAIDEMLAELGAL